MTAFAIPVSACHKPLVLHRVSIVSSFRLLDRLSFLSFSPYVLLALFASCVLAQSAQSQDGDGPDRDQEQVRLDTQSTKVPYSVRLDGDFTNSLRDTLRQTLPIYVNLKDLPSSRATLRDRLETSLETARRVLKSQGYYAGRIFGRTIPPSEPGKKAQVVLQLEAGEAYHYGPMTLSLVGTTQAILQDDLRDRAAEIYDDGARARAEVGLRIGPALAVRLKELGYPFAAVQDQTFVVDHATRLVTPRIEIDTGRKSRVVDITVVGLETVEASYIRQLADIEDAPIYDQRLVETFRGRLISTGLFSGISIKPVVAPSSSQHKARAIDHQDVVLEVNLSEGAMRQVSAQAGFSTDQGFSVEGAWSHRNVFGRGEIFTVRGRMAQLEQSVETELATPNFKRNDQTLRYTFGFGRQSTDAFNALRAATSAALERQVSRRWAVSGGGRLEAQRIEDDLGRRTFYLGALPLQARYDGTDDIFDPQDGFRLNVQITPETGLGANSLLFITNDVLLRGYTSFDWVHGTVLAARVRVGSIVGETTATLPANRRFYAGGGGSIRGYGFQNVGPLDDDGDPFGGRSLLEMAFEARVKVTPTIGIVPFLDVGNVYNSVLPKLSGLQYGAGIGVRYHTDFAPIRLDIGTPINPRAGDNRIQVYISVGQSF